MPIYCRTCNRPNCPGHTRPSWTRTTPKPARVTGRKLQILRRQLFRRQPFCVLCRISPSTIRDHIKPLAEGGEDVESNVQGICNTCHTEKTQRESVRGRTRSRQ